MSKPSYSSKNRLLFMLAVLAIVFFVLIIRLGYLQIARGQELKTGALEQWTKGVKLESKRGIIYDRKGQKLAVSVNASTIWVNPSEVKKGDPKEVSKRVAEILEMNEESIYEKITKDEKTQKIKQSVTAEKADELRKLNLPGIEITDNRERYYPHGNFASYILGFTDIDNNGLDGIESTYNKYLTGTHGRWVKATDAPGRQLPFDREKIYEPSNGLSVVLTIDETIQKFAESAAQESLESTEAKNISIIVMEPSSGDILAMALKPDYDPNEPRVPLNEETKKQWEDLPGEELSQHWFDMWRNFSISDSYEPGSTFKLITAAIALEENIASPESHFYCNGFVRDIKGGPLKCSKWYDPHKDQTLVQGMNNSCNVVFVDLGRETGAELFYKYIKSFGFGEDTGIELNGEQGGLIPYGVEDIKEIRLATMSYGHGIAVTPLQLINAVSAISNGGNLMKPRLVKELIDENNEVQVSYEPEIKRQVISKSTSEDMLKMMEQVVEKGTGSNAYIPGFRVGGKTGTAQKISDSGAGYAPGKYIGSFVAVAPVDDPQVAILVVVDEPSGVYYGGSVAAPVAKEVLEETLNYLEVPPIFTDKEKEKNGERVSIPDVRNMEIGKAGENLKKIGLKYTTEYLEFTSESKILDQFPLPGTEVEKGSIVDLYLNEKESIIVPDLMDKSKEEVTKILDDLNLKYDFSGNGKAKTQEPLPGEKIFIEEKIKVEFEGN